MSVSIYCRPVVNDWHYLASSNHLHSIIEKQYGFPCKLDDSCLGFLNGLVACGFEVAQDMINMISVHGEIEVGGGPQ